MNYIYDIYLNLNKNLFDFFDWKKTDKIIHVKKIPIIKVKNDIFKTILKSKIIIEKDFFNSISNKCEIWNINKNCSTAILITDGLDVFAIEFDKNAKSIAKSKLMIDEELDILDIAGNLKIKEISFDILQEEKQTLKTRKELDEKSFIDNELKNIEKEKLYYIYFECFGKRNKNETMCINKIKNIKENSKVYKNLYNILKLTSISKK